jgi:hypothetical protein
MPEKPNKLLPAIYGGAIMALISAIPVLNFVNCLCCAGVMFGGFMAVFFYQKDLKSGMPLLSSSDGVVLGLLAGLFGAILGSILDAIILLTVGNVGGQMLYGILESSGVTEQMPPDALEQMRQGIESSGFNPISVFVTFIIDPLFGLFGGLIGYSIYKPKPGAVTPPPPPPAPAAAV